MNQCVGVNELYKSLHDIEMNNYNDLCIEINFIMCCRMRCPNCDEEGGHRSWCQNPENSGTEWPPSMPVHGGGESWNSPKDPWVGGDSSMEIPLPVLEIGMINEEISQVERRDTSEGERSSISWDIIKDMIHDDIGSDISRQQEEVANFEQLLPQEGEKRGPMTPEKGAGKNEQIAKLLISAQDLAEALAKYVDSEKKVCVEKEKSSQTMIKK